MELNERKEKILDAVIRNYLETGEPVGSRTISKYTDLNLSSATIRNEMSDLEEFNSQFAAYITMFRAIGQTIVRFRSCRKPMHFLPCCTSALITFC